MIPGFRAGLVPLCLEGPMKDLDVDVDVDLEVRRYKEERNHL